MAVPCSIDRCAAGAPRSNEAQVIADIIGGTVRLDRQPVDVSGFAQRHFVGVPKPLIRPGPIRLGPPDALQRQGANPEL